MKRQVVIQGDDKERCRYQVVGASETSRDAMDDEVTLLVRLTSERLRGSLTRSSVRYGVHFTVDVIGRGDTATLGRVAFYADGSRPIRHEDLFPVEPDVVEVQHLAGAPFLVQVERADLILVPDSVQI